MLPLQSLHLQVKKSLSDILVEHTPRVTGAVDSEKPKARLLTSAECLAMLQKKELKKQKALEEKEQRRKEREEKKKLREEESKRKAQEKAKKAEKRLERMKRRQEEV